MHNTLIEVAILFPGHSYTNLLVWLVIRMACEYHYMMQYDVVHGWGV